MAKNVAHIITFSLVSIILASAPNLALAAPAIFIENEVCEIDGPSGTQLVHGEIVVTSSANGNVLLVCHAKVTNLEGKAFLKSGRDPGAIPCGQSIDDTLPPIYTDDWQLTVSASGQAKLSCHFKD